MAPTRVGIDALVVHVFLSVEPDAALADLWGQKLGLDAPLGGLTSGDEALPIGRRASGDVRDAVGTEMLLHRVHDGSCLSIMLPASATTWTDARFRWRHALEGVPASNVVGVEEILLARELDRGGPPAVEHTRDAVAALVSVEERVVSEGVVVPAGFAVWEVEGRSDERGERRWLLLAGRDDEAELAAWAWIAGGWELPRFVRYLRQAAVLRHELRIWKQQREAVFATYGAADTTIDRVLATLGGSPTDAQLNEAAAKVHALQADSTGLVRATTRWRQMGGTVRGTAANLDVLAEAPGLGGPFADDRALASWFSRQLEDDAAWLEEARVRAEHVTVMADQRVQRAQHDAAQKGRQRQEHVNIGLTAVTGTILAALAAIQSLQLAVTISAEAKVAVTVTIAAVALVAGLTVLRVSLPGRTWPVVLQETSLAGLAASLAVTGVAFVPSAGPAWSLLAGGLAFLAVLLATVGRRGGGHQKGSPPASHSAEPCR